MLLLLVGRSTTPVPAQSDGDGPRHSVLLGGAHGDDEPAADRPAAFSADRPARHRLRRPGSENVKIPRQRHRPARRRPRRLPSGTKKHVSFKKRV